MGPYLDDSDNIKLLLLKRQDPHPSSHTWSVFDAIMYATLISKVVAYNAYGQ